MLVRCPTRPKFHQGLQRHIQVQVLALRRVDRGNYYTQFLHRIYFSSQSQVVVDDLIPVKNNEPVFVHSTNSGEMWPCLLEKAYSKLQGETENPAKSKLWSVSTGSYCHLNGGMPLSAMVDFSGGFPLVAKD